MAEIVEQRGIEAAVGAAAADDADLAQQHALVEGRLPFGKEPLHRRGRAEPSHQAQAFRDRTSEAVLCWLPSLGVLCFVRPAEM